MNNPIKIKLIKRLIEPIPGLEEKYGWEDHGVFKRQVLIQKMVPSSSCLENLYMLEKPISSKKWLPGFITKFQYLKGEYSPCIDMDSKGHCSLIMADKDGNELENYKRDNKGFYNAIFWDAGFQTLEETLVKLGFTVVTKF